MSEPSLRRTLGPVSAIMITVGSVIGSGIFLKPLEISQALPTTGWMYAVWAGLGLVCLFGAFAYAELGAMIPEAGGQYAFLRASYGPFVSFLYGWVLLLVINSGTATALAYAFGDQIIAMTGMGAGTKPYIACAMILLLAAVNHFGVSWGAWLQNTSTFAKLAALAAIVVGGLLFGKTSSAPVAPVAPSKDLIDGIVAASVAVFWAYEGWYQLPFSAGELKKPERDLPLGLLWGMVILVLTYVSVNAIYLHYVPPDEMRGLAHDVDVPTLVLTRCFGPSAGWWLSALICLSVFGCANPNFLSTPRAIWAMSKEGALPKIFQAVHPKYQTPWFAIWSQAAWAIVLVLLFDTFKDVTVYVVFASLLFYALTVFSVYLQRARNPDRPRPFRCFGYPFTPAVFIIVALFVDVKTLFDPTEQRNALIGLAIIASGVPVYFLGRMASKAPSPS